MVLVYMQIFLINLLRKGYFGNRGIMKNSPKFFLCITGLVFTAYLHSSRGVVSSFARKTFIFCGVFSVVFCVTNSVGVFRLSVYGNARFFPAVQTICKFRKFIKIS